MIAVGSVLRILGGGLYFYGFSVFFLPLSQDLGLNRAATSLVFSLARAQGAFEGPIAGYFMDRYGPRPLMLIALTMTGIGHMLLSGVNSYITLLSSTWAGVAVFSRRLHGRAHADCQYLVYPQAHHGDGADQRLHRDRRIYFHAAAVRRGAQFWLASSGVWLRCHFSIGGLAPRTSWCVVRRKAWDSCRTATRS